MTDTPNPAGARPRDDAAFDRTTCALFFGLPALVIAAALMVGPMEAVERLAWALRHLPSIWGH